MRRAGIEMTLEGLEPRAWQRRWQNGQFQVTIRETGRGLDPDELAREILPYIPLLNDTFIAAWRPPIKTMVTGINNDFPAFTIEVTK